MISVAPTSTDVLANLTETGGSFAGQSAMRLGKSNEAVRTF